MQNQTPDTIYERLARATGERAAELARRRTADAGRDGTPRLGETFFFRRHAGQDLEWAVIERRPDDGHLLAVPLDSFPLVGRRDLELPETALTGVVHARCDLGAWLEPAAFRGEHRTGRLDADNLDRIRRHRRAVLEDHLEPSLLEVDADTDPRYQLWRETTLRPAATELAATPPRRRLLTFPRIARWGLSLAITTRAVERLQEAVAGDQRNGTIEGGAWAKFDGAGKAGRRAAVGHLDGNGNQPERSGECPSWNDFHSTSCTSMQISSYDPAGAPADVRPEHFRVRGQISGVKEAVTVTPTSQGITTTSRMVATKAALRVALLAVVGLFGAPSALVYGNGICDAGFAGAVDVGLDPEEIADQRPNNGGSLLEHGGLGPARSDTAKAGEEPAAAKQPEVTEKLQATDQSGPRGITLTARPITVDDVLTMEEAVGIENHSQVLAYLSRNLVGC